MRTQFSTPPECAKAALSLAETITIGNGRTPDRFKKVMKMNRGALGMFSPYGASGDGLERKNPVVVALGDSVTAGHFEYNGNPEELFARLEQGNVPDDFAIEVTDARVCYLEQFRGMLIDKYEQTSVSTINAGIAGDTVYGMQKRLYRDVIRYQPDLFIFNGSLNWGAECGSTQDYKKVITEVVKAVKNEIKADIVLLTPNMEIPMEGFGNPQSSLKERVEVIRELAEAEQVCLADVYRVWEAYQENGWPLEALLANGINHPSVEGHTLYAKVLMQLLED